MTKSITGVVTWLKGWFFDKDEITSKEQALQTQINNKANQSDLNTTNSNVSALQSKVNALENVELVKIVSSLPTASSSTMNTLYVVANGSNTSNNLYSIYFTVKNNNSYSWEKLDDADLQGFMTTTTANNTFAPKSHAVNATTYGLGTTGVYGHVKTVNGLTQSSHQNGLALSAYQGKVLKDLIDDLDITDIDNVDAMNIPYTPDAYLWGGDSQGVGNVANAITFLRGELNAKADSFHSHYTSGITHPIYLSELDINEEDYDEDLVTQNDINLAFNDILAEKSDKSNTVVNIQLVPKATDSTGAIKLIYGDD